MSSKKFYVIYGCLVLIYLLEFCVSLYGFGICLINPYHLFDRQVTDYIDPNKEFNNGQTNDVHKTFDKTKDGLTIDQVLEALNKNILEPNGIKLYVGSTHSALFPGLPGYYWTQN